MLIFFNVLLLSIVSLAISSLASDVNVIWHAPFASGGGYSSEALDFMIGLDNVLPNLQIVHFADEYKSDFVSTLPMEYSIVTSRHSRKKLNPANSIIICHSEAGAWHPPLYQTSRCPSEGSLYSIGRTMFETDRLPSGWSERCNMMDEIWVPSSFSRSVFVDGGVDDWRVQVIGEPINTHHFERLAVNETLRQSVLSRILASAVVPSLGLDSNDYYINSVIFLSVFKFEERKGWRELLTSFCNEFVGHVTQSKPVILVLVANPYHENNFSKLFQSHLKTTSCSTSTSRSLVVSLLPRQSSLLPLYSISSSFVLLSHGEGWCRPLVEAMSCSLPSIATYWSGMTEFMTRNNSYPISVEELVQVDDSVNAHFPGHLWAKPNLTQAKSAMREVYDGIAVDWRERKTHERGIQARRDMEEKWDVHVLAMTVKKRLEDIWRILKGIPDQADL